MILTMWQCEGYRKNGSDHLFWTEGTTIDLSLVYYVQHSVLSNYIIIIEEIFFNVVNMMKLKQNAIHYYNV